MSSTMAKSAQRRALPLLAPSGPLRRGKLCGDCRAAPPPLTRPPRRRARSCPGRAAVCDKAGRNARQSSERSAVPCRRSAGRRTRSCCRGSDATPGPPPHVAVLVPMTIRQGLRASERDDLAAQLRGCLHASNQRRLQKSRWARRHCLRALRKSYEIRPSPRCQGKRRQLGAKTRTIRVLPKTNRLQLRVRQQHPSRRQWKNASGAGSLPQSAMSGLSLTTT